MAERADRRGSRGVDGHAAVQGQGLPLTKKDRGDWGLHCQGVKDLLGWADCRRGQDRDYRIDAGIRGDDLEHAAV